jgi:hypothetical protein
MHCRHAIRLECSVCGNLMFLYHSHVGYEDGNVRSHANVDQAPECDIWRQAQVEEQKCKLDDPMNEVVVYFFNEQNFQDLEFL